MKKLNNIFNREDYINAVNEGKIGNFLKNGVKKLKRLFSLGAKKIKNIIILFDRNGDILPVVSLQAIADHFHGNKNVKVYGSSELNKDITALGGNGCEVSATQRPEDSYTDDAPDGAEEYKDWVENGYKETNFYKNLQTLFSVMESNENKPTENKLNEKLDSDKSVHYSGKKEGTGVENFTTLTTEKFEELLKKRVDFFCNSNFDKSGMEAPGNMLIFGAPGVGKSTIPREVVMAYNENKEGKDKIALISVNCANINPGDFLMPAFPRREDVNKYIEDNVETLSNNDYLKKITPEGKKIMKELLQQSNQLVANKAPQPWLPCYKQTGNKYLDRVLDIAANGAKMEGEGSLMEVDPLTGETNEVPNIEKTGSGGIILFDEFLRADTSIFNELMNFLLERRFEDWKLGSKWFVVACSNRPCDDETSADSWTKLGGAGRDRWAEIYHMDPKPEDWKNWARKKGFDETLLKFIFDKSSDNLIDGEYTRWYRVVDKDNAGDDSHKPVTPRNWMRANGKLVNFMCENRDRFKDGFSISKMSFDEVKETLGGVFDDDFVGEIMQWLHENCGDFDLEKVLENPVGTPMPMGDDINEAKVINILVKQIEDKYGEKGSEVTDNDLSNIMIWLGINFKQNFNLVASEFIYKLKYIFKKNGFWDFHKFGLLFMAAFPEKDYKEVIEYPDLKKNLCNKSHGNTDFFLKENDDILEVIKGFAKEYFPWRLKDDELIPIYDEVDDEKSENSEDE
jgi:hypothetical protein